MTSIDSWQHLLLERKLRYRIAKTISEVQTSWSRCLGEWGLWTVLKITSQQDPVLQGMALVLEGRLAGPWVEELRTYCRRTFDDQQRCIQLDLTGVTFIDAEGKLLLTQLWQQGVELRGSGCLTRCLIEDIAKVGRTDSAGQPGDGMSS
jgi:ABC-type transporter Mla MlaB component